MKRIFTLMLFALPFFLSGQGLTEEFWGINVEGAWRGEFTDTAKHNLVRLNAAGTKYEKYDSVCVCWKPFADSTSLADSTHWTLSGTDLRTKSTVSRVGVLKAPTAPLDVGGWAQVKDSLKITNGSSSILLNHVDFKVSETLFNSNFIEIRNLSGQFGIESRNDVRIGLDGNSSQNAFFAIYGNGIGGNNLFHVKEDGNDSKVGVNEAAPQSLLHITQDQAALTELRIDNSNVSGSMALQLFDGSNRRGLFSYDITAALLTVGTDIATGQISLTTGTNSEAIRIDENGKVGVNISTPDSPAHINGGLHATNARIDNFLGVGANGLTGIGRNNLYIFNGASGGSPSSGTSLVIEDDATASIEILTPAANNGQIGFSDADASSQGLIQYNHSADAMNFFAGGANLEMQVTSDGIQLDFGTNVNEFSTDGTLAGDSDDAVPTEKAVKTYVDNNAAATPTQADVALGFDTFRTPNATRPTMVLVNVVCVSTTIGACLITLDVDDSGGTTPDREVSLRQGSGIDATNHLQGTVFVPAGGSYRVQNDTDPSGNNAILLVTEITH